MFLARGLVRGGWNATQNITGQIGRGASPHTGSAFFTTPQRSKIKSEITRAAGGTGQTYRRTKPQIQSVTLTNFYRSKGWVGSPYESNMAVPVKRTESMALAKKITRGR